MRELCFNLWYYLSKQQPSQGVCGWYVRGRKWLAAFIAEADRTLDESIASNLKYKKRPARKASDEVSASSRRLKRTC